MTKVLPSYFRQHIENHFDDRDVDVVVRKRKQGYVIYWADDQEPLARFRPTGRDDEVEVFAWNGERWEAAGEFGTVLPLDEALEFVTEDPLDLFFSDGEEDEETEEEADGEEGTDLQIPHLSAQAARQLERNILLSSCIAGAVAGLVASIPWGLAFGAAAAFLTGLVRGLIQTRGRDLHVALVYSCFVAPLGCIGCTTASAVHGALGSGILAAMWGAVAGIVCNVLFLRGGVWSWATAFLAGLHVGLYLAQAWEIRDEFLGVALVAFLAAACASVLQRLMDGWREWVREHTWDETPLQEQLHELIQRQSGVAGPHWVTPRRAARD